jgi:hypothetical protein
VVAPRARVAALASECCAPREISGAGLTTCRWPSLVSGSTDRRWRWHDAGCSPSHGRLSRTGKRALRITGDLGCRPDHILVAKADARRLAR